MTKHRYLRGQGAKMDDRERQAFLERWFPLVRRLLAESLPIASYSGQEQQQAECLLRFFHEHGLMAALLPRGGVAALSRRLSAGESVSLETIRREVAQARQRRQPVLAYNAHLDIVYPGETSAWTSSPFSYTERDGRIYGRGTCDMKGAMACMAVALMAIADHPRHPPTAPLVMGCFVTEEECAEGLSFEEIISDLELVPDAVLLGEPSSLEIARGQRGKLEFRVETHGRLAHTSMPEVGKNAAYDLARVALAIERLDHEEFARFGRDPAHLLDRNTLVLTAARSVPFQRNSVPAEAEGFVTVRLAKHGSFDQIMEKLRKAPGWPTDSRASPLVYTTPSWTGRPSAWICEHPAWETESNHDFTDCLRRTCQLVTGTIPCEKIWPFSTDGVTSAGRHGIPTLGFGPGIESVAHIVDEWVAVDHLETALLVYTTLPKHFSGVSA